jgi:putative ABC transport system permease protein
MRVKMVAGRSFIIQDSSNMEGPDYSNVIINEVVVSALGYKSNEDAIHQHIILKLGQREVPCEIVGVAQNYHQRSLRDAYDPILYYYPDWGNWKYFSVHINGNNFPQNLASIENLYKGTFSDNAFEYFFLDEYFNQQYKADQQFGSLFGLFTLLAIFVACLGLLGLSSFVIKLRTKEIGIRKVVGASVLSILYLFFKDFATLIGLAFLVALPVIYFASAKWLSTYAFHIDLNWLIFVIPPLLLLIISLSTISIHTLKAALTNPVKSLRTE